MTCSEYRCIRSSADDKEKISYAEIASSFFKCVDTIHTREGDVSWPGEMQRFAEAEKETLEKHLN